MKNSYQKSLNFICQTLILAYSLPSMAQLTTPQVGSFEVNKDTMNQTRTPLFRLLFRFSD
jgi:hypothetical protein